VNHGRSDQQGISEEAAACTQNEEVLREAIGWNCGLGEELSGAAKTILFVEDEAFVRNVTSEVLRSAGYKVLTASKADEALAAYHKNPGAVDFLLTDVILPGETGMTLARTLRQEDPELRVLFVSGYLEQFGLCNCEQAECLAKPFSTGVLLQRIKQLLDYRQASPGDQQRFRRACGNA